MSRKKLPRAGLVTAALAGRISNREGATALHLTPRQFQRLKQRVRVGGALALRHQSRGQPSPRRLPAALALQIQTLLQDRYAGFNDTHLTEKSTGLRSPASPCADCAGPWACPPSIVGAPPSIGSVDHARPPPGNWCSSTAVPSTGSRIGARL